MVCYFLYASIPYVLMHCVHAASMVLHEGDTIRSSYSNTATSHDSVHMYERHETWRAT